MKTYDIYCRSNNQIIKQVNYLGLAKDYADLYAQRFNSAMGVREHGTDFTKYVAENMLEDGRAVRA